MKKKDLKAGEFYAIKDGWRTELALLLDADKLYKSDSWSGRTTFSESTATKPSRNTNQAIGWLVVMITVDTPEHREAARALSAEDALESRNPYISEHLRYRVIPSLATFLGPYERVLEEQAAERKREEEKAEAELAEREAAEARYEALAERLRALGLSPSDARSWTSYNVDSVQLRFNDVDKLLAMADFVSETRSMLRKTTREEDVAVSLELLFGTLDRKLGNSE